MSVQALHARFFNSMAALLPNLRHLHYGLADEDDTRFSGLARRLSQGPDRMLAAVIAAAELDSLPPGSRGLDVGCGLAGTCMHLAKHLNHRMDGVNLTEPQVELARARVRKASLEEQVTVSVGDAVALPYPAQTFDYAVVMECAFHVREKDRLFAELARVLKPGGRVVLVDQDRADGDLEVMDMFFFPAEGRYSALAQAAGLRPAGVWDLSHQVAAWMVDYARIASWPLVAAFVLWGILEGRPRAAIDFWRGMLHFERVLRADLATRGVVAPWWKSAVRGLREHTRQELLSGATSYRIWRFERP